jgi:hypothetical protein
MALSLTLHNLQSTSSLEPLAGKYVAKITKQPRYLPPRDGQGDGSLSIPYEIIDLFPGEPESRKSELRKSGEFLLSLNHPHAFVRARSAQFLLAWGFNPESQVLEISESTPATLTTPVVIGVKFGLEISQRPGSQYLNYSSLPWGTPPILPTKSSTGLSL